MWLEKLKKMFTSEKDDSTKKKTENLVIIIVILVITIVAINYIWSGDKNQNSKKDMSANYSNDVVQVNSPAQDEDNTEKRLEEVLSKINGVGKVKVMLTYSQTSKVLPIYNEDSKKSNTEENDKQGGSRTIDETETKKEVVYKEINGEKQIVTQSIISPQIEGAIITAQGGASSTVKANIIQAVEAATRSCNTQDTSF